MQHHYMSLALQSAARGQGLVSPNPMVGCVIVKNNQIVGQGFHQEAGGPHAEIIALNEAGEFANASDVYVTLEPCCHFNRTPPCTNALIAAKVKKIIIACKDPNSKVCGKGIAQLKAAGIQVEVGICEQEATQLNEIFFHYIQHKRPFVIAKWAMSLDGKTITHEDDTRDISSVASRIHSHQIRQSVDAILIGANTAINDNPLLTHRHTAQSIYKQPIRVVLSSKGNLPRNLKLFTDQSTKTIVATTKAIHPAHDHELQKLNIEVLKVKQNKDQQIDLFDLLALLGAREITSVLVEGGKETHDSFFQASLVNRVHVYLAPTIISTLPKKQAVHNLKLTTIDSDYFLNGAFYV